MLLYLKSVTKVPLSLSMASSLFTRSQTHLLQLTKALVLLPTVPAWHGVHTECPDCAQNIHTQVRQTQRHMGALSFQGLLQPKRIMFVVRPICPAKRVWGTQGRHAHDIGGVWTGVWGVVSASKKRDLIKIETTGKLGANMFPARGQSLRTFFWWRHSSFSPGL